MSDIKTKQSDQNLSNYSHKLLEIVTKCIKGEKRFKDLRGKKSKPSDFYDIWKPVFFTFELHFNKLLF